jgi:P pilus assembly chaperone PapD
MFLLLKSNMDSSSLKVTLLIASRIAGGQRKNEEENVSNPFLILPNYFSLI